MKGEGRSFHLEHIKKQTHHPRCVGKPGSARGPSQADNSCEQPRHPTDPVTSGCKRPGGRLAGKSCSTGRASCRHAAWRCTGCTCPPCTVSRVLCVPPLAQRGGCSTCPLCTVLWVLRPTHLHSITGAFMPTSTSAPQASWPRTSPQRSPYLNRHGLQSGRQRRRLQQPQTRHSSATRPLPRKTKNIPAQYPAPPSPLWFSISVCRGDLPCPHHACCGCASLVPGSAGRPWPWLPAGSADGLDGAGEVTPPR